MADTVIAASLTVDGGQAKQEVKAVNKELDTVTSSVKSYRTEIKEATLALKAATDQFGELSPQAIEAAKHLGELQNKMGDAANLAKKFATDGSAGLAAFGNTVRGIAGGFAAAQGAMALFGGESEDVQKTLLKVQAALALSEGLNNIGELKKSFIELGTIIKATSAYKAADNALTIIATRLQLLFSGAVDTTAASFGALKLAIAATGIGLLVVGIIAIVNALNDSSEAAEEAARKQKLYDDIVKDGASGYTEAYTQIRKLKEEFASAGTNVYKQKKALEDFNSTVGDSTGQMDSFYKAQAFLASDTETQKYIDAMFKRATATAAIGKAAQANLDVDLITKKIQDINNELQPLKGVTIFNSARKNELIDDLDTQKKLLKEATGNLDYYTYYVNKSVAEDGVTLTSGTKKAWDDANAAAKKGLDERLQTALTESKHQEDLNVNLAKQEGKKENVLFDIQEAGQLNRIKLLQDYVKQANAIGGDYATNAKKQLKQAQDDLEKFESDNLTSILVNLRASLESAKKQFGNLAATAPVESYSEKVANGEITQARDASNDHGPDYYIQKAKDLNDFNQQQQNNKLDETTKGYALQLQALDQYHQEQWVKLNGNADAQIALDAEVADKKKKIAEDEKNFKLGMIASFADQAADIVGRDTVAGKAFAISAAVINTWLAATVALKSSPPPFNYIQTALTIAAGLKAVYNIVNTPIPGKGSGGGAPSAGSLNLPSAPLTPAVTPTQTNTTLNQDQVNQIGNAASRVYVLDSDIQNNRERDARLNRAARLGGG